MSRRTPLLIPLWVGALGLCPRLAVAARLEAAEEAEALEAVEAKDLLGRSGLNESLLGLASEAVHLQPGESEVIFIRHGWSLNNKFQEEGVKNILAVGKIWARTLVDSGEKVWKENSDSEFKAGYEMVCHKFALCGDYSSAKSSLNWEIGRMSRDSLLHPVEGEEEALKLGQLLLGILPSGFISGVFVSPLRRTLQTALAAFGHFMTPANSAVVPWLHEKYKSDSDLANDGPMNAVFLERYAQHLVKNRHAPDYSATVRALMDGLNTLGKDWVDKYGSTRPTLPQPEKPRAGRVAGTMPYYQEAGLTGRGAEDKKFMAERMVVLRRFLKSLPPGRRYVLVSHGGVCDMLFGKGKVENLALVTGRYFPAKANPDTPEFFHDVMLARDRWQRPDLPGWRQKKDD